MSRVYYPECRVVIKAVFENFGKSLRPLDFPAIPKKVTITRNSYKQPDSWSIELDGKDFPIPPSLIRAAQIEVYLYDKKGLFADRRLLRSTTKPAIVGLIDSAEATFSNDGRTVKLSGQDMTSLFAAHKFQKRRNFTNVRLDQALIQLIDEVDLTHAMKLVIEVPDSFGKLITQGRHETRSQLPVIGKSVSRTNKRGFPVKRGETYWNVMYNLAIKHGFILFVRDLEIVLASPRTVFENSTKRADRTFKLTWGKNIEEITLTRKMGKEKVPQVEVISYDERTRTVLIGKFPKKGQKVTEGVGTKRLAVLTQVLRGITDVATLNRLARLAYNLIARTEQAAEFETKELVDEGDRNLIFLKTGDAFFVSFDPYNSEELRKVPAAQRSQWLVSRGFSRQAANTFANHFEQLNTFRKSFYVREARIEWAHDKGLSIGADIVNFVTNDGIQEAGDIEGLKAAEVA